MLICVGLSWWLFRVGTFWIYVVLYRISLLRFEYVGWVDDGEGGVFSCGMLWYGIWVMQAAFTVDNLV